MKTIILSGTIIFLLSLTACNVSPVEISYDYDQCAYCKMTISDSRFGSELVTTKGKVYKYDAIECLIPELIENGESNYKYILVTDFYNPKKLIDGTSATYLISNNRPSPMGANLSAYKDDSILKDDSELQEKKIFTFQELLAYKSRKH